MIPGCAWAGVKMRAGTGVSAGVSVLMSSGRRALRPNAFICSRISACPSRGIGFAAMYAVSFLNSSLAMRAY
jgi:hypothetical protein